MRERTRNISCPKRVDRPTQVTPLIPWSIIVLEQLLPTTALRINRVAAGYTIIDILGQFYNYVLPTIDDVFLSQQTQSSIETRRFPRSINARSESKMNFFQFSISAETKKKKKKIAECR